MLRRLAPAPVLALALAAAVCSFHVDVSAQSPDTPIKALPYTPGLDVAAMDRSADPCEDFYQYACGGWMKANPIPADQASWDVYRKLGQDNQRYLWGILEELSTRSVRTPVEKQVGDYFAACMDEEAVEKKGLAPLKPLFARIAALRDKRSLARLVASLQLDTGSAGFFFGFGSNPDFENSESVIAFVTSGGLGLPDRDYYVKNDDKTREIRNGYLSHVERMFELAGDSPSVAHSNAAKVMEIETVLAHATLTRVEQRDPYKLFHKYDRARLKALSPAFDWDGYLETVGLRAQKTFNVTEPEFFKEMQNQLLAQRLDDLKVYLRWQLLHATAPYLPKAFVDENFSFFSKRLRGVPELRPRWKRCVALVDLQLGEALGREFVKRAFSPDLKARALHMTQRIEDAMAADIRGLDWMSDATKAKALEKLHSIVNKIGYPDRWRDYSSIVVRRDDFFGNTLRAQRFESKRDLAKIGKPVDRTEWFMTPPTVNAYYSSQLNDINFPAGVLQPPLFDPKMDDAPNYGNTGGTIGHELTHGFDDEGRKYDARGNLTDWWTKADAEAFESRTKCVADQYAQYTVVDEVKINSQLTLGEDVADLGGLVIAWAAWRAEVADKKLEPRDDLSPEQRFFVGYAQWACENQRPENLRLLARTDPHSPARWRVNGLMVNMPEFERAFACKPKSAMVPEKRCRVW